MAFKSSKGNPREYIGKAEFVGEIEKELTHLVYDCSLDLEERKKKVVILDSAAEVAALLGVKIDSVFKNRKVGKRIKGINGKYYAVRVLKNKNE